MERYIKVTYPNEWGPHWMDKETAESLIFSSQFVGSAIRPQVHVDLVTELPTRKTSMRDVQKLGAVMIIIGFLIFWTLLILGIVASC